MLLSIENIKYIASQATLRKDIVFKRYGVKSRYSKIELRAQTDEEVELFDSIDCLNSEEFGNLVEVAKIGGLKLFDLSSFKNEADYLYLEINLDVFINKGLSNLNDI